MWQAGGGSSACPGKDGEGSAASRAAGSEESQNPKHQSSASPVELHPMVEPTKRPQVPKSLWNLFIRDWITTGQRDRDSPELEAALLWGCLWDCPRIPVLPMGLPEPARSEQSIQVHRAWHPLMGTPDGSSPPLFTSQGIILHC